MRSTQLHHSRPEELTSSLPCPPLVATACLWEVGLLLEDSVHENTGLCSPTGLEGLGESPSKAFLESIGSLLSSLDICRQGTTRVSVCLLALNGQRKVHVTQITDYEVAPHGHLGRHPKTKPKSGIVTCLRSDLMRTHCP